jgi:hypothetical protein
MSKTIVKEEMVKKSNQPQNEIKGSINDISTLMMYKENVGLLLKDGVKETIQQIVEFHKRNNSGKNIIDLGERLLIRLEYMSSEKKKERITKFLKWRLDDELQQIDWMEKELSDVEDEISEYRELESDGYDDLDEINNLIQSKEDLEYSIQRCEIEVEENESLLKKLKVKKIDSGVLDRFCNDNGLKIKDYEKE